MPCLKDLVIQIPAVAGLQGFRFNDLKGAPSIRLSFGTQEQGGSHFLFVEAMGQFILVCHEENLDVSFQ